MQTFVSLIITAIILGTGYFALNGIHWSAGNGQQVGYVSATEIQGAFFKTNRAYIKPTLESTQEDVYCVVNPEVYAQLTQHADKNVRVRVSHVSWWSNGMFFCKEGENAVITAVEPI